MSEKMPREELYNLIYSDKENAFLNGGPLEEVTRIPDYLEGGRVLDIGGGNGRNAVFLAKKGFEVKVVDISEVGLSECEKEAQHQGVEIETLKADITTEGVDEKYDVLIASLVFHHIEDTKAQKLIAEMKEKTNESGINVVMAITKKGDSFEENPDTQDFFLDEGELSELYSDWEILEYSERKIKMLRKKPDGTNFENVAAKILARKPI